MPNSFHSAILSFCIATSMLFGCTSTETQENTLEQVSTIQAMRYSQLLTNISAGIDHKDVVPSQGVESSGTATTSATGTLSGMLAQAAGIAFDPFALGRTTRTLSATASDNWQNNWSITPISDPQDLQNLRALYGLLYRTDAEVVQFIIDTMKIRSVSTTEAISPDQFVETWNKSTCGISLSSPAIVAPEYAMEAYFNALNALPAASTAGQKLITCYGEASTLGLENDSLAAQYGLLYPAIHDVTTGLRNGLSPACRHYQLENMWVSGENSIIKGNILFTRWLFWKGRDGSWAPTAPPSTPEFLGSYGGRDFWTTSRACLDDFIILTINATANSHAAAQSAPKATPTPSIRP